MKRYVILAGVNGAGKSTLFSLLSSLDEIEKINLDETVREIVKERIEDGANEKAAINSLITALSFASISIFPG